MSAATSTVALFAPALWGRKVTLTEPEELAGIEVADVPSWKSPLLAPASVTEVMASVDELLLRIWNWFVTPAPLTTAAPKSMAVGTTVGSADGGGAAPRP